MAAIKGKVIDAKTGKPVYNAHVIFTDENGKPYSPLVGTVTGFDGGYSFDSLAGYHLKVTYMGYADMIKPVDLSRFSAGGSYTNTMNFQLQPTTYKLPEVVIRGQKPANSTWWAKNKGGILILGSIVLIGFISYRNNN